MKLIGISGKKRSGKDTLGHQIACQLPNVIVTSFAKALKAEIQEVVKLPPEFIERSKEEFRPLLQWWGTEFRRKLYPGIDSYWIDKVEQELSDAKERGYQFAVITDVRFPNEAQYVKMVGGILINVVRDMPGHDAHSSENALNDYGHFDYVVENNGTLADLLVHATTIAKSVSLPTSTYSTPSVTSNP